MPRHPRRVWCLCPGLMCLGVTPQRKFGATGTTVLLDMRHVKPAPARTEMLWFGPGISDELNRMIKLGKVCVRERGRDERESCQTHPTGAVCRFSRTAR